MGHPGLDAFLPLRGERFDVIAADARTIMTLASARELPGGRPAFELIFRSPPGVVWPQGTYRFAHARLGEIEMFVSPFASDAEGTSYQAIFG